ncbi:MAG: cytochrome c peroxidase [Vicinamibacterales bacterium]
MKVLAAVAVVIPLGLGVSIPVPAGNPLTPEKIEAGRRLFADTRLSRDGTIACTSCHDPERAFTKLEAVSPGVFGRRGHRNAPTLINRAWGRVFFWDGRAATLEEQVLMPIEDPNEMDLPLIEASARVGLPTTEIAQALASYVRSLMSGNSPFDRFAAGDCSALSPEERNGLRLFQGRGNCSICHDGANFTDEKLHNTGVAWASADDRAGLPGHFLDEGGAAIGGSSAARGTFKTPTLREVGRTAPYMHDGSLATLDEVVDFYNRGGRPNPHLDPDLRPLDFSDEDRKSLVAFLRSLSAGTAATGR